MDVIFVGGSRRISRLPAPAMERLDNIIDSGSHVLVGDANGVDKAVQKYLFEVAYSRVTVFCSGDTPRNNLGHWGTHGVRLAKRVTGFQFYAAKDREMAHLADFGLMIWDGKSPGTILNILRLSRAQKKAVLIDVSMQRTTTFRTFADWERFLSTCSAEIQDELRKRATPEEWMSSEQEDVMSASPAMLQAPVVPPLSKSDEELTADISAALARGDSVAVIRALGHIARVKGMSRVAKNSGLARESLYRSLSTEGNPEFATVLKVVNSLGLRLTVNKAS